MAKNRDGFRVINTVHVKPSKLNLTEEFRGRATPVADEEIVALADSLRSNGQQQPLQVRAIEGTDRYDVIFGNTRALAGQKIEDGYTSGNKEIAADDEFDLRCEVVECTNEEAFTHNIVENAHRNQTTPIDDAKNQAVLRDQYEMTDAAIARLYGYSGSAHVNRLKKLLSLPQFVQDAIHSRSMTASAGFTLADAKDVAEAEAYEDLWKRVKSDNDASEPSIGNTQLVAGLKEWRAAQKAANNPSPNGDGETPEGEEGHSGTNAGETNTAAGVFPMTLKTYKSMLEEAAGNPRSPEKLVKFCTLTLETLAGKKTDKQFGNGIMKLLDVELLPKQEEVAEKPAKKAKKGKKEEIEAPVG